MGLKKAENQVRVMLADTIVAMCRNTLNYHGEVCVEGLLGITLDKEEIFLVSINQTITNPEVLRQRAENEANDAHGRKRRSEEDESDSESSGSEAQSEAQSEQSKSKKSRRKRRKRKTSTQSSTSASDSESEKKSSKDHDTSGEIPEIHRLDDSDKSDNETNNDDNSTTNDLINHAPVVPIFPTGHAFPGVFPGHPFVPTTPLQVPHQVPGHGGQSSAVSIKSEKSDDDIKSEHADSNSSAAQQYSDFVAGAAAQFPAFNQLHLSNLAAGENSNPFHNASLQLMASQQQVAAESGVPQPGPSNPVDDQQGAVVHLGEAAGTTGRKRKGRVNQCSLCGKVFPAPSHVARHMVVHTGNKFYGCPYCGRGLSQKVHLVRHLKSCVMNPNREINKKAIAISPDESQTQTVHLMPPPLFHQAQGLNVTI